MQPHPEQPAYWAPPPQRSTPAWVWFLLGLLTGVVSTILIGFVGLFALGAWMATEEYPSDETDFSTMAWHFEVTTKQPTTIYYGDTNAPSTAKTDVNWNTIQSVDVASEVSVRVVLAKPAAADGVATCEIKDDTGARVDHRSIKKGETSIECRSF